MRDEIPELAASLPPSLCPHPLLPFSPSLYALCRFPNYSRKAPHILASRLRRTHSGGAARLVAWQRRGSLASFLRQLSHPRRAQPDPKPWFCFTQNIQRSSCLPAEWFLDSGGRLFLRRGTEAPKHVPTVQSNTRFPKLNKKESPSAEGKKMLPRLLKMIQGKVPSDSCCPLDSDSFSMLDLM